MWSHMLLLLLMPAGMILEVAVAYQPQSHLPPSKQQHQQQQLLSLAQPNISRRGWLLSNAVHFTLPAAAAAVVSFATNANAATSASWTVFEDSKHGFSLEIPSDWIFSQQTLRDRRSMYLWTQPSGSDDVNNKSASTALYIVYTPVRDDFTSLNSFGTVDQVAAQTILPKTALLGTEQSESIQATMIQAISRKSAYFFDYKQTVPGVQPETHYRTIFTLAQGATGGAGAVLVTITAQTPEQQYQANLQSVFDTIIESYRSI